MGSEYQALIVHTKKKRRDYHHPKGKHSHHNNPRRDLSSIRCTCDEKGHISKNCPRKKGGSENKKNYKRRHHAHTGEDDEPPRKRVKEEDSSSDEEYVLISTLTGTVTHGSNDWLIDSGAPEEMHKREEKN